MNTILASLASHTAQQVTSTLLDLAIAAAVPFTIRYVNSLTHLIKDQRLRDWTETQVLAVEQRFTGVMTNEGKRQAVVKAVKVRFPKVPESFINSVIEASVKEMKQSVPAAVTVPVENAAEVNIGAGAGSGAAG